VILRAHRPTPGLVIGLARHPGQINDAIGLLAQLHDDGYCRALAAHREAMPPRLADPAVVHAVERQNRALRELSRQAFPEPDA